MIFFSLSDINECNDSSNNCHVNAECTNNIGSFSCECMNGYSGDGVHCQGIKLSYIHWIVSPYKTCI